MDNKEVKILRLQNGEDIICNYLKLENGDIEVCLYIRLSKIVTLCPTFSNISVRTDPIYPDPPVISIFILPANFPIFEFCG